MKRNTLRQWLTAGAMACALWQTAALAGEKITLHLVYTSDTYGYVDACG